MIATIINIDENGRIDAKPRRSHREYGVDRVPEGTQLRVGDRIEVCRQTNNPYLIYIGRVGE